MATKDKSYNFSVLKFAEAHFRAQRIFSFGKCSYLVSVRIWKAKKKNLSLLFLICWLVTITLFWGTIKNKPVLLGSLLWLPGEEEKKFGALKADLAISTKT